MILPLIAHDNIVPARKIHHWMLILGNFLFLKHDFANETTSADRAMRYLA